MYIMMYKYWIIFGQKNKKIFFFEITTNLY